MKFPSGIDYCKVIMNGMIDGNIIILVFPCKHLFVGEFISFVYRKKCEMSVRIGLIEVDNERYDILFTISSGEEIIHILCPVLNILCSLDMRIVSSLRQINRLTAECNFMHPFTGTAKNEVYHRTVLWFIEPHIRVNDATCLQVFLDS